MFVNHSDNRFPLICISASCYWKINLQPKASSKINPSWERKQTAIDKQDHEVGRARRSKGGNTSKIARSQVKLHSKFVFDCKHLWRQGDALAKTAFSLHCHAESSPHQTSERTIETLSKRLYETRHRLKPLWRPFRAVFSVALAFNWIEASRAVVQEGKTAAELKKFRWKA